MSEKELKMFDVDAQLDAVFGKEGTPERKAAEDRANAFFTGQIIEEARKKANMTQAELAGRYGFLGRWKRSERLWFLVSSGRWSIYIDRVSGIQRSTERRI